MLKAAADEALAQSATLAADLFAAAVEAGADRRQLAARRAHAVAPAGDLDQVLLLADGVLSDPVVPDRPLAISVASAALAHRGLLDRGAHLARRGAGSDGTGNERDHRGLTHRGALATGQAAGLLEPVGETTFLPDTPAALTALVALYGWLLMVRGKLGAARRRPRALGGRRRSAGFGMGRARASHWCGTRSASHAPAAG